MVDLGAWEHITGRRYPRYWLLSTEERQAMGFEQPALIGPVLPKWVDLATLREEVEYQDSFAPRDVSQDLDGYDPMEYAHSEDW